VIVADPSDVATVTSTAYTVNNASSTIINIAYGTASSTFISQISGGDEVDGQSNQTWDYSNINNPVMTGNTLVVTAEDGVTTKTYTIIVNDPSSDAALRNIIISKGTLKPSFSSSTKNYTASVSSSISSVTIKPTQYESHSIIKVNNSTTTSGQASLPISLIVGSNLINIQVTAQDSISTSTYTINVTRAKASTGGGGGGGGGISKPLTPVITTNTPAAPATLSVNQFIELLIQIGVIPPEKVFLVKLILGIK
jgi:hypothetical protein